MPFKDRADAGRKLARALAGYKDEQPVLLALPRGGVSVAAEVVTALEAPLDLILVRKIGFARAMRSSRRRRSGDLPVMHIELGGKVAGITHGQCRTAAAVSSISSSALRLPRRFRRRRREFGNRVTGGLRAPLILAGVIVLRRRA